MQSITPTHAADPATRCRRSRSIAQGSWPVSQPRRVSPGHAPAGAPAAFAPAPAPAAAAPRSTRSLQRRSMRAASSAVEAPPLLPVEQQPGLVFGVGQPGSWDEAAVGSPVVRCYVGDDEQRWFMWYSGRRFGEPGGHGVDVAAPSSGSIGVAISRDGINWSRGFESIAGSRGAAAAADVGRTIAPNGDWWTFDTCHLTPGDVQVLSNGSVSGGVGVYWMFYTGGDYEPLAVPEGMPGAAEARHAAAEAQMFADGAAAAAGEGQSRGDAPPPGTVEGLRMRAGLAMSQDGKNWARIEADHHTGALFDVGGPGEPDEVFVHGPQVVSLAPRDLRMFYTTWDTARKRFVVASAASPDGFKWTKKGVVFDPAAATSGNGGGGDGGAFDALGAAAVSVVRDVDNRQLLMFYEAVAADNSRCIGMAVSKDGTSWRRFGAPVLQGAGEAGAWDEGTVGAPCGVSMSGGRWRLYYGGRQRAGMGPWQGIGLALSAEGCPTFEGVPTQYKRRAPKPAAPPSA